MRDRHSQVHVARVALVLALALLGDALLYVVLPLHAPSFGVTFAWVGILLSANRLVRIIGYGAVAKIGRRIGLRRLTIAAAVGATLSTAAYGLAARGDALLLARIVWGLSFAALNLTTLAYAVREASRAGRLVGATRSISAMGPVLSLTLGAWLVTYTGPQAIFLCLAAVTALAMPLAWMLPDLAQNHEQRSPSLLSWPSPLDLWAFAVGFAVDGIFVTTLSVLLAGFASFQSAVLTSGALLATRRLVEVLMAPIGGSFGDRWGASRMLLLFGAALSAGLVLLATGQIGIGAIVVVLAHGVLTTIGPVLVAERNPDSHLARLSAYVTWRDIGAALGPLAAGFTIGMINLHLAYAVLGCLLLLVMSIDAVANRRAKPLPYRAKSERPCNDRPH